MNGIVKFWTGSRKLQSSSTKKIANTIFTSMSVAHVDDDDLHSPGEVYDVEKEFPDGDAYVGQWVDGRPNGNGKYLWSDGCMYVGEWEKGKTNGKGKFMWPSGAVYEGQFKKGYMDGEGIYTGSENESYMGAWVCNMKHGKGTNSFPSGDRFKGEWRGGLPDGQGRYQWYNGNQYIGQWRTGKMNGKGTMRWANGNRYDGNWEDGLPKGNGTYRWAEGSFYIGVWSMDPNNQSGSYYPANSQIGHFDWDPQELFKVDLKHCVISQGEKIPVYPSQKSIYCSCDGSLQKQGMHRARPNRSSIDESVSVERGHSFDSESDLASDTTSGYPGSVTVKNGGGRNYTSSELSTPKEFKRHSIIIQPPKKQGVTISKDHKNYDLMLNLQLGIRHSVGRPSSATSLDLRSKAFDTKEKLWTRFPPGGSKTTPPHQSCEFKWKDYCPLVFRTLRKLFNVDAADYMLSICGNDALRELSSPGKSGSFFYLTNDDKYMIKTMKKSEAKVLLRMLPAYYNHVRTFENTLITKFYGLHCVKMTGQGQKKVRFVIIGNLFRTDIPVHRRFDLKGSSHGRLTGKDESEIDSTTTLKDLDLNLIFRLQNNWLQEFCRQVDRDSDFLEQERIMDYSLLVGIHFRELSQIGQPILSNPKLSDTDMDPDKLASMKLGVNMPACAELTVRRDGCDPQLVGEPTGEYYDVILYFGIIDILQDYDITKKLEHAYKAFQYDPTSISAVDPRQYSRRFRDFIYRIFTD